MANLCNKIKEGIKKNQEHLDVFYKWIPIVVNDYVNHIKENKEVSGVSIWFDVNAVRLITFTKRPLEKHSKEYIKIMSTYADNLYSKEARTLGNGGYLPDITKIDHNITYDAMCVYSDYIRLYKRKK